MKSSQLKWDSFTTPGIPTVSNIVPPGRKSGMWSPMTATLIYGERDAVLVDTFITVGQGDFLVDWIKGSGKNLTTIYITHGHGDHFFNIAQIQDQFPNAKAVATPGTLAHMKQQVSPEQINGFWNLRFPGQIPERLRIADELKRHSFELEGNQLVAVELGHTDTDDSTCLHVPSIGLVVAGDGAYNGVHQMLVESREQGRQDWLSALDIIESLKPRTVIAGHKRPGNEDDPRIIEESRQYIRDFGRLDGATKTAQELYDEMLKLYPRWMNVTTLWASVHAAKAGR